MSKRIAKLSSLLALFYIFSNPLMAFADSLSQRKKIANSLRVDGIHAFYDICEGNESRSKLIAHVGFFKDKVEVNGKESKELGLIYRRFYPEKGLGVDTLEILVSDYKLVGFLDEEYKVYRFPIGDDGHKVILGLEKRKLNKEDYEEYIELLGKILKPNSIPE